MDELYQLGGTSGGARPKILTTVDGEEWIIKFPAHVDGNEAGIMEYEYSLCAKKCGIQMTETKLFDSEICGGYFGIKRFDRGAPRVQVMAAGGAAHGFGGNHAGAYIWDWWGRFCPTAY